MTYMYMKSPVPNASKITISTWVYISQKSIDAQKVAVQTIDKHAGTDKHTRIPIMEFGSSVEPRVGLHMGFEMDFNGYLGACWWSALLDVPDQVFLGGQAQFWVSGIGITQGAAGVSTATKPILGQWSPFAAGVAKTGDQAKDYDGGWVGNGVFFFTGTSLFNIASFFYPQSWGELVQPVTNYNGFNDKGINNFNVRNYDGLDFPISPGNTELQHPNRWTYNGTFTMLADCPRCNLLTGDKTVGTLQINSEFFFVLLPPVTSQVNGTMQPIPSPQPGGILANDGGPAKHFAYGALIAYFPMRPGVNYGEPANPSVLYIDGGTIGFSITGKWPGKNWTTDGEIVPTLNFSGGPVPNASPPSGGFKVDSWNHIFFTTDLTTMVLADGNIDRGRDWLKPATTDGSPFMGETPLISPYVSKVPISAMVINGGTPIIPSVDITTDLVTGAPLLDYKNIMPSFCVFMDKTGFAMELTPGKIEQVAPGTQPGQIGFPVISQEINRWSATGPNADICYAYTHIWLDKYIEPTEKNLLAFFARSKNEKYNFVVPPSDKKAAVKQFGMPNIWCYRDKNNRIRFEDNQGTAGKFTVVGPEASPPEEYPPPSAIRDFRPGPGQTAQKTKEPVP